MSSKRNRPGPIKDQKATNKLVEDLITVNRQKLPASVADNEMLSLIVDEAIKGVDISKRYPDFYKKLLDNPELRSAFLGTLESLELAEQDQSIVFPETPRIKLSFLTSLRTEPIVAKVREKWRIIWQRNIEQLQDIISPAQLVYRSDTISFEDPWFTLMREEVALEGALYTIALECTLSDRSNPALSPFLNIAVTLGVENSQSRFPILSALKWGKYNHTIHIPEEGRARFPDIPFNMIFDSKNEKIIGELNLTIEPAM